MEINPHSILLFPTVKLLQDLGMLEQLQSGLSPFAVSTLTHPQQLLLQKILDYLVSLRFLKRQDDRYFLESSVPARAYVDMLEHRNYLSVIKNLETVFIENKSPAEETDLQNFDRVFYAGQNSPEKLDQFLASKAFDDALRFTRNSRLAPNSSVVDLGGGSGAFCFGLTQNRPDISCKVVDLAPVESVFLKKKIQHPEMPVVFQAGDVFRGDFPKADYYFLRLVLHDFNSKLQKEILANLYRQIPPQSTLIIGERLLDRPWDFDRTTASLENLVLSSEAYFSGVVGHEYGFGDLAKQLSLVGFEITQCQHQDLFYIYCRKSAIGVEQVLTTKKYTDLLCQFSNSDFSALKIQRDVLGNIEEIFFDGKRGTTPFGFDEKKNLKIRRIWPDITTLNFVDKYNFQVGRQMKFEVASLCGLFPSLKYQHRTAELVMRPDCAWELRYSTGQIIAKL